MLIKETSIYIYSFVYFLYKFQLVIANMLQSRKSRVIFVSPSTSFEISLTKDQMLAGTEIEEYIVNDVVIITCFHNEIVYFFIMFGVYHSIYTFTYRFNIMRNSIRPHLHNDQIRTRFNRMSTAM